MTRDISRWLTVRSGRCIGATLCAVVIALQLGCVTRTPLASDYPGPRELPSELAERFAHDSIPGDLDTERDALRERRDFSVHRIVLPAAAPDADGPVGEVAFEYYDIDGDELTPVVVVLPIANGNMLVSRYFGRYFADRGWSALVVDRLEDPLENVLGDPEQIIRRNVRDYRRVLDWVEQEPSLGDVGVFGISFGGMAAVMLGALDDRVDALVVAMAGGDLPYLMVNTTYRGMARQINRELRESEQTRERLEAQLDERIVSDPLVFAPYVNAEDVLLVMTRTDMIVPIETQEWLRQGLGEPETLYLPTGHRTSVFYFPLLRNSAYSFFENRFSASQ